MNLRNAILIAAVALTAAGGGYWLGKPSSASESMAHDPEGQTGERVVDYYQSPMHPWIVSDEPGRCTICGMALVPVYVGQAGFATADEDIVQLTSASAAVIGVATADVKETELTRTLRVNGVFEIDHTRHRVLSARVPGRIEDLALDQVGVPVKYGDVLATLYSPEMLTAQRIYVERRVAGPGAFSASQFAEAREQLLNLGITVDDIVRLESTRQPEAFVTLRAPFDGIVVSRGERAYAGSYVEESDTLFEIGDMTSMWFIFDVYESDLGTIRPGQTVTISSPSHTPDPVVATVSFINPNLDPMTRTAQARVVVENHEGLWQHHQTATAELTIALGSHLTVPRSAVLFTRGEPVVFVAVADQSYRSTRVKLGPAGDNTYAIATGLEAGDRVVSQAALMIEGQAQLSAPPTHRDSDHDMMAMQHPVEDDVAALQPFVLAAADAAEALAADQLTAYVEALPALHENWQAYLAQTPDAHEGPLDQLVNALSDGPTLTDARDAFEPFSTAVADLARQAGLHHNGVVNIFQCPMSPVLGKGRWVQRGEDLRNPFFGSEMLTCGSPIQ